MIPAVVELYSELRLHLISIVVSSTSVILTFIAFARGVMASTRLPFVMVGYISSGVKP